MNISGQTQTLSSQLIIIKKITYLINTCKNMFRRITTGFFYTVQSEHGVTDQDTIIACQEKHIINK